ESKLHRLLGGRRSPIPVRLVCVFLHGLCRVATSADNPTAQLDPLSFHPDGSNSEQIIAGERSKIDPLKQMKSKRTSSSSSSSSSSSVFYSSDVKSDNNRRWQQGMGMMEEDEGREDMTEGRRGP